MFNIYCFFHYRRHVLTTMKITVSRISQQIISFFCLLLVGSFWVLSGFSNIQLLEMLEVRYIKKLKTSLSNLTYKKSSLFFRNEISRIFDSKSLINTANFSRKFQKIYLRNYEAVDNIREKLKY